MVGLLRSEVPSPWARVPGRREKEGGGAGRVPNFLLQSEKGRRRPGAESGECLHFRSVDFPRAAEGKIAFLTTAPNPSKNRRECERSLLLSRGNLMAETTEERPQEKEKPKVKHGGKQLLVKVAEKEKKKKKAKKKEKVSSPSKKRSHSSTLDETDKLQSKNWTDLPLTTSSDTQVSVIKDHGSKLSSFSPSNTVEHGLVEQINESLRWHGMLADPLKEEERIRVYKTNRRRRYLLAAQERLYDDSDIPRLAGEDLHLLQREGTDCFMFPRKDQANSYFFRHEVQNVLKDEDGLLELDLPQFAKISQRLF